MPLIRVSAEIDLEDVFDDCDDEDLLREVARRGFKVKDSTGVVMFEGASVNEAIGYLKENGCPQELVEQLAAWAREPIATTDALNRWLHAARRE